MWRPIRSRNQYRSSALFWHSKYSPCHIHMHRHRMLRCSNFYLSKSVNHISYFSLFGIIQYHVLEKHVHAYILGMCIPHYSRSINISVWLHIAVSSYPSRINCSGTHQHSWLCGIKCRSTVPRRSSICAGLRCTRADRSDITKEWTPIDAAGITFCQFSWSQY